MSNPIHRFDFVEGMFVSAGPPAGPVRAVAGTKKLVHNRKEQTLDDGSKKEQAHDHNHVSGDS